MTEQLTLTVEAPVVDAPSGKGHRAVLVALFNEGTRGLSGEEAAQRCGFRDGHIATSRMGEMAAGKSWKRDLFPVPLTWKSETRERLSSSGTPSYVFRLTDVGERVAGALAEEAA